MPVYHLRRAQHVDTTAARGARAIARASDPRRVTSLRGRNPLLALVTNRGNKIRYVDLAVFPSPNTDPSNQNRSTNTTRLTDERSNETSDATQPPKRTDGHATHRGFSYPIMPEATARVHELSVNHQFQGTLNIGQRILIVYHCKIIVTRIHQAYYIHVLLLMLHIRLDCVKIS